MDMYMTPQELREARFALGRAEGRDKLTITEMAGRLNTPRGTYEKWESGARRVPGIVEVAIKLLLMTSGISND
nr:hypothetical protein 3 [bacterium]